MIYFHKDWPVNKKGITIRLEYEDQSKITIGPVSDTRFFETKYTEVDLHLHDSKILGKQTSYLKYM